MSVRLRNRKPAASSSGLVVEGVVDLAVEREDDRAVGVHHRLMAPLRQVENLESMKPKGGVGNAATQRQAERAAIVGPAVTIRSRHRRNHAGVGRRAIEVDEPGDSAHVPSAILADIR